MNKRFVLFCVCILVVFVFCCEPIVRMKTAFSHEDDEAIHVLIDPGHGGIDGGAVGISGAVEKDINLDISKRIFDLLGLFGISAKLTRNEDVSLGADADTIRAQKNADLRVRVELANKMPNAHMLSIHLNSFPDASCHGAQVFYSSVGRSKDLAKSLQTTLRKGLDPENHRVIKPAESGHYLLKQTKIPCVIIECGFLSNRTEEVLLLDPEYQKRLAACIVQGYRNNLK